MTRTETGLTATTDERRRFRMLIRLAKAGQDGQTPRSLIRAGGSIERPAFTAELERLTEIGAIEPIVDGVERYRLTPSAMSALGFLFPETMYGSDTPAVEPTVRPPSEFVWQPQEPVEVHDHAPGPMADVDPSPQPPGEYFWADPAPDSTPGNFWESAGVMTVNEARELSEFWS